MNPSGPFNTKNELAGFLVLVIPLVLGRLLGSNLRAHHILYGGVALVLLRALWLSGSRGGLVAALAAMFAIAILLPRRRLLAAAIGGILGLCLLMAARPDLADRPMFQRFATLTRPAEVQNLRWRQEQWQLFLDRLEERPWLGTGSEVDSSLYAMGRAGTTHSGYLGVAVRAGIPSLAAWLLLLGTFGWVSLRSAVSPEHRGSQAFWIGLVGFLVALLVHNLVENTLAMPQIQQLLWTALGLALLERARTRSATYSPGAMRG
jgi:O-antigen ligase